MAANDLPDEAVEAATEALWTGPAGEDGWPTVDVRAALAAAAPHMADHPVPDEAVEAVIRDRARRWGYTDNLDEEGMALWLKHCGDLSADLAAAAPHFRAQFFAEVDAALRDDEAYVAYLAKHAIGAEFYPANVMAAGYLRDTLGAGGEGE